MLIRPFIGGLATYFPLLSKTSMRRTGGTDSAAYCYSVWLRHLVMACKHGLSTMPHTLAELGPGDSLGIGLAALLSGAQQYYAFDVVKYANTKRNLLIFDELVDLFRDRSRIPDDSRFPGVKPNLDRYDFPAYILTDDRLQTALDRERLTSIRQELADLSDDHARQRQIAYFAPWDNTALMKEQLVDMVYSQAVLEHVSDLDHTYRMLGRWLKPGGHVSSN